LPGERAEMPPKRPRARAERRETSPVRSPFPAIMEMQEAEARAGVRRGIGAMEKAEASSAAPHRTRAYIGAEEEYISRSRKFSEGDGLVSCVGDESIHGPCTTWREIRVPEPLPSPYRLAPPFSSAGG